MLPQDTEKFRDHVGRYLLDPLLKILIVSHKVHYIGLFEFFCDYLREVLSIKYHKKAFYQR